MGNYGSVKSFCRCVNNNEEVSSCLTSNLATVTHRPSNTYHNSFPFVLAAAMRFPSICFAMRAISLWLPLHARTSSSSLMCRNINNNNKMYVYLLYIITYSDDGTQNLNSKNDALMGVPASRRILNGCETWYGAEL